MTPIWHARAVPSGDGHLDRDLDVDVCVVGAGITGITLACELVDEGRHVVVLDMRAVGQGATGHTSAHLTAVPDVPIATLVRRFGEDGARQALEAGTKAIDHIERNVTRDRIPCDFERVTAYRFTERDDGEAALAEDALWASELAIRDASFGRGPLPFMLHAAKFPNQAIFHPLVYVQALARRLRDRGAAIYEGTRVVRVDEERDGCTVVCAGSRVVRARRVVYATHTPLGRAMPMQARIAPYNSYCIAVRLDGPAPRALFYDDENPYHYVRTLREPDGEVLIVGGADHKCGQEPDTERHYAQLEEWTHARFPMRGVVARWSWPVFESVDGLPYIGRLGRHPSIYVATGFAGNGLTFGTFAALEIARMLRGEKLPESVFRPQRYKPLVAAERFVSEAANVAAHLVGDRLTRPSCPTCPHMGGIVQWNPAEATWDCPLHGSRFLPSGKVLCGPATEELTGTPEEVAVPVEA